MGAPPILTHTHVHANCFNYPMSDRGLASAYFEPNLLPRENALSQKLINKTAKYSHPDFCAGAVNKSIVRSRGHRTVSEMSAPFQLPAMEQEPSQNAAFASLFVTVHVS